MDMSYIVETQDPCVEMLTGDRCKAKNSAWWLQILTATSDDLEIAVVAEVFKAMGDPFRLAILKLLRDNELCVCEINLSILKKQALVKVGKVGKWSRYRLSEGAVIEMMKLADLMMGDGWLPN